MPLGNTWGGKMKDNWEKDSKGKVTRPIRKKTSKILGTDLEGYHKQNRKSKKKDEK